MLQVPCMSGAAPKTPAILQEGTGEGEDSIGRRNLILPGRAGKFFPNSLNQNNCPTVMLKGTKQTPLLIRRWYFSRNTAHHHCGHLLEQLTGVNQEDVLSDVEKNLFWGMKNAQKSISFLFFSLLFAHFSWDCLSITRNKGLIKTCFCVPLK